ncbi:(Fe-S)-binding protein [Thermobrachium celere]|uniref:(Fe-S)-binding protein n=1 Tax=Thermobrachium celere TaxID=53422 RepID=UPI0019437090|nr:(Fe-S)-binding protein [Thermobrachium celere]GFR35703.1 hypothetical protein TCEA9_15150 [Thermobrachium celere]
MLSNSKIFTTIKGDATIGFMPGCSLSSYNPTLVMKIYDLLKSKYNDINLILRCCGNPSYSIGETKKFNEIYNSLYTSLNKKNINKIITACQTCYKTLRENSPNLDIVSLWEEIKNFDLPKLALEDKFYIFDSCSADENIKKKYQRNYKKTKFKN